MNNKVNKLRIVLKTLKRIIPKPQTELYYENGFQLLIAVVLSAQCTDERVNKITKDLFKKFPDPYSMYKASEKEIYEIIKSCSYPNSKTKYLKHIAKELVEKFNGKVPDKYEDLIKMKGIGRKSANVVLSILYKKPVIAVDTHIKRVSIRLGFVQTNSSSLQVEKFLTKNVPQNLRAIAHHYLLLFGRYYCKSKKPLCNSCPFIKICDYYKNLK